MKIAITGGAGFIGTKLTKKFADEGHEILILDHHEPKVALPNSQFVKTDLIHDIPLNEYLSCDAVIHLAGANIFGRWSESYKKLILSSRIDTAKALIDGVKKAGRGPKVFITASAVGYYGDGGENELTEESPNGEGFLAKVCAKWEEVAKSAEECGMRTVFVRTGVVLGKGGGMLAKLIPIFKWGLGGRMGSGKQWFSWIFMDDLLNVYKLALLDNSLSGPVNAVSPEPVRNQDLVKSLGSAMHRPAILPVPGFILRIVLGEFGRVILMSQKVVPKKLLERRFKYIEPKLERAIINLNIYRS